jgi:hypothetical protein
VRQKKRNDKNIFRINESINQPFGGASKGLPNYPPTPNQRCPFKIKKRVF